MFQQAPPMQNNSFYSSSASGQAPFFGGTGTTQNYGIQAASMFGGQPSNPGIFSIYNVIKYLRVSI